MSDPRYTDEQMAIILRRAAELQERGEDAVHRLRDIQRAAAEAGIDPALVARAAAELAGAVQVADDPLDGDLFGAPRRIVVDRWVEHPTVSATSPQVLSAIRQHTPELGEVRQIGDGIEWRCSSGYSEWVVVVSPSGPGVRVHAAGSYEGRHFMLNLSALGLGIAGGVAAMAIAPVALAATAVGLGVFGGGVIGARSIWNGSARRERDRLVRLADAAAAALQAPDGLPADRPRLAGHADAPETRS
jgi:hypothetical protein